MQLPSRRSVVWVLVLCAGATLPSRARAWGNLGHEVIAAIAAARLTPQARAAIAALLAAEPDGGTLPAIATWADAIRSERPETERWHFVDIPIERQRFERAADCVAVPGAGDCVVAAVERERATLSDPRRPQHSRVEALKFIVHFIGDMHQPLHCARRGHDRGGNEVLVTFFGRRDAPTGQHWNLHAVWDAGLIFRAQPNGSADAYTARLLRWLKTQSEADVGRGTIIDWVNETHRVARTHAYRGVPPAGAALARRYYAANISTVDAQLAKAGLRLARLLNQVFP